MKEYSLLELKKGLDEGTWTSKDLLDMYLEQIKKHDQSGKKLNAVAVINPDAYAIALALDSERKKQGPRSLLHGIPILIKDNIQTDDKMPTTASSFALKGMIAPKDAFIVKQLREAGMIILGKTNLSEFAYFMSNDDMPSGYGSLNGQVKSPYSHRIDPLGSSTGSAVAVASNMIPVSIGTETNGSLTAPAQNNSICTIKPTLGLVSRTGIIPISHLQDTAGPMGRTVEDIAVLLEYMVGKDESDKITTEIPKKKYNFSKSYKKTTKDLRIAFLRFSNVKYSKEEQEIFSNARNLLKPHVSWITGIEIELQDMPNDITLEYEFKHDINEYLNSVKAVTNINSLKDLIDFNKKHSEICLKYGQSIFESAEKKSGDLNDEKYLKIRSELFRKSSKLTVLMKENDIDVVVLSKRTSHAPIYGNPVVCVPAKALNDFTPKSLFFVAKPFDDELALRVAYKYESLTKYRIPPTLT